MGFGEPLRHRRQLSVNLQSGLGCKLICINSDPPPRKLFRASMKWPSRQTVDAVGAAACLAYCRAVSLKKWQAWRPVES